MIPNKRSGIHTDTASVKALECSGVQTQNPARSRPHRGRFCLPAVLSLLAAWLLPITAPAAWTPNPETDVVGYTIFVGTTPENLLPHATVAKDTTSHTLTGLAPSTTYYCSVQAFNTTGLASGMSSLIIYTTPATALSMGEISVQTTSGSEMASGADAVSLGAVAVDSASQTETITIKNRGIQDLTGLDLSIDGTGSADFLLSSLAVSSLAPGASTTFDVTFLPTVTGNRNATISITSNDADENPFLIAVNGEGTISTPVDTQEIVVMESNGTSLTDGSTSLTFGSVNLGGAGVPQSFILRNTGDADLTNLALVLDGSHASDYIISGLPSDILAPGESMLVSITFKPLAAGSRSAALHILSNDPNESPFDIALAGTGVATPEIAVEQTGGANLTDGGAGLSFGSLNLGTVDSTQTIIVRNTGSAALTALALTVDGSHATDFTVSSLPSSIAVGASATVSITFKPLAAGSRSAVIHIASNDADENSFDIALAGTGVAVPEIAVERPDGSGLTDGGTGLTFGSLNLGASGSTQTITISNPGTASLTGLAISVTGSHAADFTVSSVPSSVSADASTTFNVTFTPLAAGSRGAVLHIASNDADESPFDIALAGTGVAVPEIAIEKSDGSGLTNGGTGLSFGSWNLGASGISQTLTIKNPGTAALSGLSLTVGGGNAADFTVSSLATSVAAGANANFTITFKPLAAGSRNAVLHIASNDADEGPFNIALAGTGVTLPEIAVEKSDSTSLTNGTAAIPFGSLNLGASGSTQSFTIRNQGTAILTGLALSVTGSHVADFAATSLPAAALSPGDSMTFNVTFTPGASGSRNASIQISSNDSDENPFDIALSGTGIALPEIAVEKDTVNLTDDGTSHFLGSVILGDTGTSQSFTIRNPGTAALTGIAINLTGSHVSDFVITSAPASSVAPGASTSFRMHFKPGAAGPRSATLKIASNDADENPFDIPITGNGGVVPEIAISNGSGADLGSGTSSISFGDINLQSSGATHLVTIHNLGSAPLTGISHSLAGSHPSDFSASIPDVSTLAPGTSTTIKVAFNPAAAGRRSSVIYIASNDANEDPFAIVLTGTGIALPEIDVTRTAGISLGARMSPISLGRVELGHSGAAATFTIHNRGAADLANLSVSAVSGHATDFVVTNKTSTTLAPGASATFEVFFRPKAAGNRDTTIRITSNDGDENPFDIPVTGSGLAIPDIAVAATGTASLVSSSVVGFATTNTGATGEMKTFTIRNTGSGSLTGLKVACQGTHSADFDTGSPNKTTLTPGASTSFKVTFNPRDSGIRNASLRITSNDPDEGSMTIPLSGRSLAVPDIAVRVSGGESLEDGESFVKFSTSAKPRVFTITNRGNAKLTNLSIQPSGIHAADFTSTRVKVSSLDPGESASFKVAFAPTARGTRWAAVKINSNDPDTRTFDIVLTGRGDGASSKSAPVKKPSPLPGSSANDEAQPVVSVMLVDGQKYRCITIPKTKGTTVNHRSVEVSGNLVDWFSGGRHTTVVKDNDSVIMVRDNIPMKPGGKRRIRLKNRR